jgi:hypothetical protein
LCGSGRVENLQEKFVRKEGTTSHGYAIHTSGGNEAELYGTIYYGRHSVLHFRIHHEPEHVAGAAPEGNF